MEAIAHLKNRNLKTKDKTLSHWHESLVQNFYVNYYQDLSSKELDKEFRRDVKVLTEALGKLQDSERKALIEILSRFIEFYMENKVEKELDNAFSRIFKF